MDMFRNTTGFEQKLLVTFRARRFDLEEIVEDVIAVVPAASFRCAANALQDDAAARPEVVDVGMELPDDAAVLNSAMRVIFHAQGNLPPSIKVRRVLGEHASASPSGQCLRHLRDDTVAAAA